MMKCEVIQDLIPLYVDECCSEESRRLVEEHIENCSECRELLRKMRCEVGITQEEEIIKEEQLLKEGKELIRKEVKRDYYKIIAMVDFPINLFLTGLMVWQRGFLWSFEEGYPFDTLWNAVIIPAYLAPLLMLCDAWFLYLLHKKKKPNISENLLVFSFVFKGFWFTVFLVLGIVFLLYMV